MSNFAGSSSDYINSVKNCLTPAIASLKTRVTDVETRVNITETYNGTVFFTNGQGNSMGQILNDASANGFIENLVAGRPYNYSAWYDSGANHTYNGGTYPGRIDANGKYPRALPLPIGSSATLITDQFTDIAGMHCDVYMLIKGTDSKWSYFPIEYNVIKNNM